MSWYVEAPLGQSRPSLIGLAGLPSISMMRPFLTKICWLHPTAQKGQTEVYTEASRVRGAREREVWLIGFGVMPTCARSVSPMRPVGRFVSRAIHGLHPLFFSATPTR